MKDKSGLTDDSQVGIARKAYEMLRGIFAPEGSEIVLDEEEKQRALRIGLIKDQIWNALDEMPFDEGYPWLMDVYVEENGGTNDFFALLAKNGKLFRWPIDVEGDSVEFGEMEEVAETFTAVEGRTLAITRQDNGRVRVAQIVNTAVLNRVGEIDSTLMFDKFIEHAQENEAWPLIDVMHWNEVVVGRVVPDGLMRDEWCYIAVWEFDDTELGRAAEEGFMADPEHWGSSIQFYPLKREFIEADGMSIPVFVDGVNTFITITPETRAAAWFTGEKVSRSRRMTEKDFETLVKLIGEDQAAQFSDSIRQTNADIDENDRIARQQAEEVDAEASEEVVEEETEEAQEEDANPESDEEGTEIEGTLEETVGVVVELDLEDQTLMRSIADAAVSVPAFAETVASLVREMVDPLLQARDDRIAELVATVETLRTEIVDRIGELERDDDKRKAEWLSEIPVRTVFAKAKTHRPRQEQEEDEGEETLESFGSVAEKTLSGWAD